LRICFPKDGKMPVADSAGRGTHTRAEILSQPEVWRACLKEFASKQGLLKCLSKSRGQREWLFVGCGTSFYLAEAASASWTLLTSQFARALPASELLLFPRLAQLNGERVQAVVISRSGQTSEAVRAAEFLTRKHKLPTLGVTCARESELATACQETIVLTPADEKSVVMTRSFTSMLLTLQQIASGNDHTPNFSSVLNRIADAVSSRIETFSDRVESFVANHSFADYVYLGQGPFFPIAREAALKITEMSHSYAQAYHTLEFRHGPKSIVGPETCVTFFLSESGMQAESEVLAEMKELGGTIVAVCNKASESLRRSCHLLFELEADVPEYALIAPFVVPGQLLGLHTGIKKGFNPDEPKNLSRVVILD
jgi:glutamine---fructose-6-phosphate transaminase (isomerizing)